jgi:hypothetical protein
MPSQSFFIAAGVGAGIGAILSVLYGVYSKSDAEDFTRSIFGVSTHSFLNSLTITLAVLFMVLLGVISFIVKDGEYPREHPWHFSLEVLASALIPALLFAGISWSRGNLKTFGTVEKFVVIAVKLGLTTVLLQYSGYFRAVFPSITE